MDLSKIKTLIDFVGRSNITELTVTEKDLTVRIFRSQPTAGEASADLARGQQPVAGASITLGPDELPTIGQASVIPVKAPVSGVLHRSSAPGEGPFVKPGDEVTDGQTLFIIEAMKVFNKIAAPRSGRIVSLTEVDGGEVETGDLLAEIA
ncbi:acetyl-CoA carboxylase biotin carboxyl carrier protein [Neorhizobium galegae]|uniref:acetyl-CoA carboxylase biotin carboxyl carrier protein n=1 Tax=Neorhizobium galegae TaxID=399 RepID=UPI0021059998|nr:acetyl-CoA carboxylase biotin carboxyl carrier protein subunit [Neorhizobium galegae]MCQ1838785.1 acetyl-CoA carboxylase biotin carboxyl carrier protein subunit [Neorhizobium galegae]